MVFYCPYCNEKHTDISDDSEVRQAEFDYSVYHVRCQKCFQNFRLIEQIITEYTTQKLSDTKKGDE